MSQRERKKKFKFQYDILNDKFHIQSMNISPSRQTTTLSSSSSASASSTTPILTQTRSRLPSRSISPYPYRSRSKDRPIHQVSNGNKFQNHDEPRLITRHQLANLVNEQDNRGRSRSKEKKKINDTGINLKGISLMGFNVSNK